MLSLGIYDDVNLVLELNGEHSGRTEYLNYFYKNCDVPLLNRISERLEPGADPVGMKEWSSHPKSCGHTHAHTQHICILDKCIIFKCTIVPPPHRKFNLNACLFRIVRYFEHLYFVFNYL